MNLYPAIDLYEGKVVRLTRGDYSQKKIYSENPAEMAKEWESQGAAWIHVVDLEGAKTGVMKNRKSLAAIRKSVQCQIQFGGGLRSEDVIADVLDHGVNRAVIGTKALDEAFFRRVMGRFRAKIAVGLDVRDDKIQTQGWLKEGGEHLRHALTRLNDWPLETIIFTDISKDGTLLGPSFAKLQDVLQATKANVILSGGVSTLADIKKSLQIVAKNFEGVIIGRALYEKQFELKEAVSLVKT